MTTFTKHPSSALDALVRPRSIAVLGASASRKARGNDAFLNLKEHAYAGDLIAIHPSATSVEGVLAVPTAADVPFPLDLALVALPAPVVPKALDDLSRAGCKAALVGSAGMTTAAKDEIRQIAESSGMVVHGPNCMGLINVSDSMPLWFYHGHMTDGEPGNIAIVAQSGSATVAIPRSTEGVQYSKIISTGDEIVVTTADYLRWLATDGHTDAVGVVLESIRNIESFADAVDCLRRAGKPLVVLKVGRTPDGAAATQAHTGAMIGSDEAYSSFFDQLDVPLVRDYDEMAAVLECYARPLTRKAAGDRIGVVTMSGGQGALTADLAATHGVPLATLTDTIAAKLDAMLPGIGSLNPLDFGASPTRAPGLEATVVETLASDPGVDVVVVVADGQSSLREAEMEFNHLLYGAANRAAGVEPGKPLLLASSSSTSIHPTCRTETGPDVPTIRGLANALVAVRALSRNRADVGGYLNERATLIRADKVSPILQADEVGTSRSLSADATNDLLDAYGITRVRSHFVKSAAEALVAAATIGYPVVAKFLSQDITHRSDVGGVITGISTPAALESAISLLEQRADALGETVRIDGFEIQSFVPKAIEAMVGFVADPVFGATVAVGMGGVLVELLRDIESAPAPVGEREAHRMVDRSRLGKLLAGYRNLHRRTDAAPLVELVGRVSRLAIEQSSYLQEGDFNPVLVEEGTGRVVVVDALLVRKEAPL